MWHQLWIPVLIPTLIIKSNCDENKTDSDNIFIRYGGHAEANYGQEITTTTVSTTPSPTVRITTVSTTTPLILTVTQPPTTIQFIEEVTESDNVFFVPNKIPLKKRGEKEEEYTHNNNLNIRDIMMMKNMKTVKDVMTDFHVENQNDAPEDIVFISGKNHDNEKVKQDEEDKARRKNHINNESETLNDEINWKVELHCKDLDCNNTIHSICGAKLVNHEWKHRLFLNDCYFRKVNCGLKYEANRYTRVEVERCKMVGAHYAERRFSFKPKYLISDKPIEKPEFGKGSSLSRRSMTMNFNGEVCSHPCPVTCPEDYDPQCAVSGTGQRRVFLNHCKLDHNSCSYSVVWHRRPLAECVGGKKVDMRNNRGFIGWMQRVGIVDSRGKLVLE